MMPLKSLIIIISIIFCNISYAAPLIPGGIVTSPFGEENHFGHTHAGIDVALGSGTPILAPSSGIVTHGTGNGYIYWVQIDCDDGFTYFIGDCREETLTYPVGRVAEGTIIGLSGGDAYEGPLGISTGPHAHIEMFYATGYLAGSQIDPAVYLSALGVDLSGNYFPSGDGSTGIAGGSMGSDNVDLPWGVETMYKLGDNINSDIDYYSNAVDTALNNLNDYALGLAAVLAIIDLTLPICIAGIAFSPRQIIAKIFKYGFLFFLLFNWEQIINDFFVSMVSSISGSYTGDVTTITQNITQPQLLIQKCVYMMTPALNKIASFKSYDFLLNLHFILPIWLITWITIIIYILLASKIAICYVEFYLTAVLNIVTLPFANLRFFKFLPEGTLGHLISVMFQLIAYSIMVFMMITIVRDASPGNVFALVDQYGHTQYMDINMLSKHFYMCVSLWGLAFITDLVPPKIAKLIGGKFDLP